MRLCGNIPWSGVAANVAVLIAGATAGAWGAEVSFNRDVRPILSDRCFACHGPDAHERKAKLRLDRADGEEGAYRTRDGVTAIVPGSLDESELWRRVTAKDPEDIMPPPKAHKEALDDAEKAIIRRWIEAGAPYEQFWAFVLPKRPELPTVRDEKWGAQPIDRFVLARLEGEGLAPSEEGDWRTLVRRVTFDLTGLPPTLDELRAFEEARDGPGGETAAYEALVDRLLASPQYGEHMARYWLDLVRFADTNGMHKDFYRNNVAYRDWVIRSFNENLGYDDFVRYQLAGDLFPEASNDQLVASGFNRLHLIIDKGTALPEESHFKNVIDRVTAVGTAFMGLTVHCATCHDHKYDPLTQKDFYSLYAFFNNIDAEPETRGAPKDGLQPPLVVLGTPEQKKKLAALNEKLAAVENEVKEAAAAAKNEKDAAKREELEAAVKALTARRDEVRKQRDGLEQSMTRAMVMKEREKIRPAFIMKRGQYDDPGEPVERDTPEFLPPMEKRGEVASRLDLADWFVDRDNPLTARVAVNRFWQQFFGVGLVKTSEDLGAQGEVPSHPELLDYLAVSFMESGWDVKTLVREIVMSRTYRQSSVASPERFKQDPENRMLARGSRFRMDAEMIRDQILATSGLLSPRMFGESVKPPQPDGLWKAVTMIGERFRPDTGEAIYRRSVYTYWKRGMPPPQMTILNAPIRDACVARRERTNTPAQALLLLNEDEYLKAARTLARKVLAEEGLERSERIGQLYEIVTSHRPDEEERKVLGNLLDALLDRYGKDSALAAEMCKGVELGRDEDAAQLAAWTVLVNTLYNMDIAKTRE